MSRFRPRRRSRGGRGIGEEAGGIAMLLFLAGTETTASLVGNALLLLARHPEQRARLVAAPPGACATAVEEILRFEAPIQNHPRLATEDVHVHRTTIPAGSTVLLLYASANRDERRWEDADRLDVLRAPKRHLAFGDGVHFCAGAGLARLEARLVLEELVACGGEYAVGEAVRRLRVHSTRGLVRLPISF